MSTAPLEPTVSVPTPVADRYVAKYPVLDSAPWIAPRFSDALAAHYLPKARGENYLVRYRLETSLFAKASAGLRDFEAVERRYAVLAEIARR